MKNFGVIGNPLDHSLSPTLHSSICEQINYNYDYKKFEIKSNMLKQFTKENNLTGYNVTIPYKTTITKYLKKLDNSATQIGAVNCVYNNIGFNTDWLGFKESLFFNGIEVKKKRCLIFGAGGAAKAIAYALKELSISNMLILNRSSEGGLSLVKWIKNNFNINASFIEYDESNLIEINAKIAEVDIIINCTPIGMWPNSDYFPELIFNQYQTLIDLIYNPPLSAFMKLGNGNGAKTISGLDMFIFQGIASAEIWLNSKLINYVDIHLIKSKIRKKLC